MQKKPTKRRKTWQREAETHVRQGWQRYTTYYRKDLIASLRQIANEQNQFLLDVIDQGLSDYVKKK